MLSKVTFTGIDNFTRVDQLQDIQTKYPEVEFGVLVSANNTDKRVNFRYPDFKTIEAFQSAGLNLSCHVCGGLARSTILSGDFTDLKGFLGDLYAGFQRFQFNVNGKEYTSPWEYKGDVPIIIQAGTEVNVKFFEAMQELNGTQRVLALFDKSGGRGQYDKFDYVPHADQFVGYAGGITKNNVCEVVRKLDNLTQGTDYWIDMESSVRVHDVFSVYRANQICELLHKGERYA